MVTMTFLIDWNFAGSIIRMRHFNDAKKIKCSIVTQSVEIFFGGHFYQAFKIMKKTFIRFAVQIQWLVSMWNAILDLDQLKYLKNLSLNSIKRKYYFSGESIQEWTK